MGLAGPGLAGLAGLVGSGLAGLVGVEIVPPLPPPPPHADKSKTAIVSRQNFAKPGLFFT